eukprot:TRINITY_DN12020_c0_g1_i1.p1 TRINITY_DN12020_c0_g1~~TRINITY_DN12020_c0_g1_i1.p1  ORF type:complete len:327 (+),score=32.58 TRINITY_DN12020_c0_g1_i1:40-1020(+)
MNSIVRASRSLLSNLPRTGVKWSCCYGSKVMEGNMSKNSQLDVLIAIDDKDISSWHNQNRDKNPHHYSSICSAFGSGFIDFLQSIPPGLYFHPYITIQEVPDISFKYGVMSLNTMLEDLQSWNTMYIAGRLQKPVCQIYPMLENEVSPHVHRINTALSTNYTSAVAVACILLHPSFTIKELFLKITELSYLGDVRMKFAENPEKVQNIVNYGTNLNSFYVLYKPTLDFFTLKNLLSIDTTSPSVEEHRITINVHPSQFKQFIAQTVAPMSVNNVDEMKEEITKKICSVTNKYSKNQTIKGLVTSGVRKSIYYASQKVSKRLSSKKA